jgi:flagellum-specific peptidoglycan hydrolase FlgJ
MNKQDFLRAVKTAAMNIGQKWPGYVAAEAALESSFGNSELALQDLNLFGMKQHKHPVYGTVNLPTREFIDGEWQRVQAAFIKYPDWESCLRDRLATLTRLAPSYPHYSAALAASDGPTFITEVSKTWSTDPDRSDKVLKIYSDNIDVLLDTSTLPLNNIKKETL